MRAWRESRFELVMSRAQLTEIARVLTYPKIRRILKWGRERIERLLKQIYVRSVMVESEPTAVTPLRDADDIPSLQSLIAAQGDCPVNGAQDLLTLRHQYPIVTPAEFSSRL